MTKEEAAVDATDAGVEPDQDIEAGTKLSKEYSSVLDSHDDPFAPREGKTLVWKNVMMTLAGSKGEESRKLLDNVWGEVPPKETTAVMGPSGAGKTSLLNILAGRAASRGRVTIEADVRLNNYAVDPTNIHVRKQIAFVGQDESLQVTATPRESIRFSAKLRLPRATTDHQLDKLTNHMLAELGLTNCADTIVGGALIKGISGGERKRTSVGVELVVKPALVFLDEPTSGLDSFSAVQLCQVLKKVANAGASVLFTIHQPASEIFNSFDHLILMNRGRVMYQGAVPDVPAFFRDRGHPNPPNYNPADWIMNVAQSVPIAELDKAGFFPVDERDMGEAFEGRDGKDALGITISVRRTSEDYDDTPVGMVTQTSMLFTREVQNVKRDTASLGARFGLPISLAILIGVIFLRVGKTDPNEPGKGQQNVQSRFGALIMVLLMSMFITAQHALLVFPTERPVFLREYSTNHYSVVSYFVSRLTMEAVFTAVQILLSNVIYYFMIGFQIDFGQFYATCYSLAMASTAIAVMLGCSVEDPKLAQEMLPVLFVPQMLFSGFFVTPSLIPVWLRWARYLCSLTFALRILLIGEFEGCYSTSQACKQVLDSADVFDGEKWWFWLILVLLFVCFRLLALFILHHKATKFF